MTKTYEKYKDSGVAWIGEIPEGWKVYPFKSIFKTSKGLNITKADLTEKGIPVINYGQIHSKNNPGTRIIKELIRYVPEKYIASNPECLLPVGSILFADTSEDIEGCGNAVYIDQSDIIFAGYHTVVAKPNNSSNKYIAYQLLTDCWRSQIRSVVNGIKVLSINQKFINSTSIIFPPLSEQQSIASFLDEKCGEIDSLIALQEEMITELQDYKQSVISEVVTKGLDPNAQMKDSGVEWIGEIPEGWKVYPFKSIFKTSKGLNITKADLTEKGIPVINYGQIHSKNNPGTRIIKELIRYVPEKYIASNPECLLPVGSILFADTSEDIEGCGNAVYIDQSDIIFAGYHTVVAKPNNSSNKYIAYQLLTDCWRSQIRSVVNGIKVLSINQKFINSTSIIFPPLSEQQQIATYLDEKTQQIDTLITLKQQKIEELKDYKKSIIYEYVTGKKKV